MVAFDGDQGVDRFVLRIDRHELVESRRVLRPPLPRGASRARESRAERRVRSPVDPPRVEVDRAVAVLMGLNEQRLDPVDERDLLECELALRGHEATLPEQSSHVLLLAGGALRAMDLRKAERAWIDDASRHAVSVPRPRDANGSPVEVDTSPPAVAERFPSGPTSL